MRSLDFSMEVDSGKPPKDFKEDRISFALWRDKSAPYKML